MLNCILFTVKLVFLWAARKTKQLHAGVYICPFERHKDIDVVNGAVTEIYFFFNGQKFVQQINKVKRRLSLLRNKSKTSLLKYHIIIESLLWKMRWWLDFTKRKITISLLAQWNNKIIKNIIFPCIFHCKCPSIFSFQSKELSSLCSGGNWSWLGSCFGGLRPWL